MKLPLIVATKQTLSRKNSLILFLWERIPLAGNLNNFRNSIGIIHCRKIQNYDLVLIIARRVKVKII